MNWLIRVMSQRGKAMSKATVFKNSDFRYEEMSGLPVHNTTIARLVTPGVGLAWQS